MSDNDRRLTSEQAAQIRAKANLILTSDSENCPEFHITFVDPANRDRVEEFAWIQPIGAA